MKTALSFAILCLIVASPAEANINRVSPINLGPKGYAVGWHSESAVQSTVSGYSTGWTTIEGRPTLTRGFLIFDLQSSLRSTPKNYAVVGAELEFRRLSYVSPDPVETLGIFDVTTPDIYLYARSSPNPAIFRDLGSGVQYASVNLSPENSRITIPLNADAIHDIRAKHGGVFSFGLSLTSASPSYIANENLFSLTSTPELRILIGRVPEPPTFALAATSLLALSHFRRNRPLPAPA